MRQFGHSLVYAGPDFLVTHLKGILCSKEIDMG